MGNPPEASADFVCAMEDVLEVYTRPYDPARPVVCLDKLSKQLVAETRIRSWPNRVSPNGWTTNTNAGGRRIVPDRRTLGRAPPRHRDRTAHRRGLCQGGADLLEVRYPHAEKVVLVMDNLNTHKPAAVYEAFEPAVAPRSRPLEIHHTPKHGSWLNMAEIELSVLSRQCQDRRIPDLENLTREVAAWEQARNADPRPVNWRFTTPNARIKLSASPVNSGRVKH